MVPVSTGWVGRHAFAGIAGPAVLQSGSLVRSRKNLFRRAFHACPAHSYHVPQFATLILATTSRSFPVPLILVYIRAPFRFQSRRTLPLVRSPARPAHWPVSESYFFRPQFQCRSAAVNSSVAPAPLMWVLPHLTARVIPIRCQRNPLCPWHVTISTSL